MARVGKIFIIILALCMLAGCDDVGPGSGGGGDEVGVAEDASGERTFACLRITFTAQGEEVMARLYLNGQMVDYVFFSPQVTQQSVYYSYGNYSLSGSLTYSQGSPFAPSRLGTNGIRIGCDGQTTTYSGTIFTW